MLQRSIQQIFVHSFNSFWSLLVFFGLFRSFLLLLLLWLYFLFCFYFISICFAAMQHKNCLLALTRQVHLRAQHPQQKVGGGDSLWSVVVVVIAKKKKCFRAPSSKLLPSHSSYSESSGDLRHHIFQKLGCRA